MHASGDEQSLLSVHPAVRANGGGGSDEHADQISPINTAIAQAADVLDRMRRLRPFL
jgi:hypothetical protein